jgi:dihydrofolate synthase
MIELGLNRIGQLVKHSPLKWKAIHVAGTNGKGSITAYISAILGEAGVLTGRFNSPHLIDRWDCISIQDHPVPKSLFSQIEDEVIGRNERLGIGASEFELLTATAFEIFNRAHVQVGVVEVGLGGRSDATNVLQPQDVLVSVISKIGLDHQSLLGHNLNAIAMEKAGIMKQDVPCVADGTNERSVLEVLSSHAETAKTTISIVTPEKSQSTMDLLNPFFQQLDMPPHQQTNLLVAIEALKAAESFLELKKPIHQSLDVIPRIRWPGRLQIINLYPILGRDVNALLDGAHNPQAARVLSAYIDQRIRRQFESVTWILAVSKGKDVTELVRCIVKPQDKVIATQFGPVDGMPWVKPVGAGELVQSVKQVSNGVVATKTDAVEAALQSLSESHASGSIVIAGSLYLVSDVLRLLRDSE